MATTAAAATAAADTATIPEEPQTITNKLFDQFCGIVEQILKSENGSEFATRYSPIAGTLYFLIKSWRIQLFTPHTSPSDRNLRFDIWFRGKWDEQRAKWRARVPPFTEYCDEALSLMENLKVNTPITEPREKDKAAALSYSLSGLKSGFSKLLSQKKPEPTKKPCIHTSCCIHT